MLLLPGLLTTATIAAAQQPTAAALARQVDLHYNHLHSLQAVFTERFQGMGQDRTESGVLTLQKPGRMRWAYNNPPGKLFILDGRYGISYTPGDPQAMRLPSKQLDDVRSPLRFLLGHAELEREFDHLTLAPLSGGLYTLTGTPDAAPAAGMKQLQSLALSVDPAGEIHSIRVIEADGTVTNFTFDDERENAPVPPSAFTFTPPPGVTIVNGAP